MPENPDKNTSWKSLAGNLFGIEFDEDISLDDVDLDSVADAVEQLNAPQPGHDHDCSRDHDHDVDESDLDFEALEALSASAAASSLPTVPESSVLETESTPPPAHQPQPAGQTAMKKLDKKNIAPAPSTARTSYEDEDLFGFGIMVDDINSESDEDEELLNDTEDEEFSAEVVSADEEEFVSENLVEEPAAESTEELSLEDFDFDFDFEDEEEPVAPPKSKAKVKPAAAIEPPAAPVETPAPVVAEKPKPNIAPASAKDDDFWSSLEEWDYTKDSGSRSQGKSRRSEPEEIFDEPEVVEAELSEDDEDLPSDGVTAGSETEERPRKRSRRRRRRPRKEGVSAESQTEGSTPQTPRVEKEIDPEDIDRLWSDEEEEESLAAPAMEAEKPASVEPKRISRPDREENEARRGRGHRSASARSEEKPVKQVEAPAAEIEEDSAEYEVVDDLGDAESAARKYKNVPTWTEAIGMIVRRRDPAGSGDRNRSRRDSGRNEDRRGGTPRRRPRRREES